MPEWVIRVEGLTKQFGEKTAVDDLSLSMRRGEVVGLLGVNGAGKTTALQMLLGLTKPTRGRIDVFGHDLQQHRIEILRRSNFSSAYANLPSNLRVWQNMMVFARLYGVRDYRAKTDELLTRFGIDHLKNSITGYLSSGESTRLNICKSLLNDPELLMLDEPTASLDPDIADKVRTLLKEIQSERNMTVLYTSHNMRDIEEVCDRIIFIHQGRKISEGTPQEVMQEFEQKSLEDVFIRIARSGELEEAQR